MTHRDGLPGAHDAATHGKISHTGRRPKAPANRRRLLTGLKLGFSILLIGYFLSANDLDAVGRHLRGIQTESVVLALSIIGLSVGLVTLRWTFILRKIGVRLRLGSALHIMFIGLFFNQMLPSTVGGDAVRTWRLHKAGVTLGASFRSVILDRVVGFSGLVLLVVLGLPFVSSATTDAAALWSLLAIVFSAMAGLGLLLSLDKIPFSWLRRGPLRPLNDLAVDARSLFFAPGAAAFSVGLSLVVHFGSAMIVLVLALGMEIEIGALECVILVPPVILISVLPISMAGWGVREGAMITALGYAGIPPTDALVLSLAFGLVTLVASVPGGILWFVRSRPVDNDEPG